MTQKLGHWFRLRQVAEMLFDFSFVIVGIVIAVMWISNDLPINYTQTILFAIILAGTTLMVNSVLGLYQRIHNRSMTESRARAVLSLYLSVPVAYGVFGLLPMTLVSKEFLQLSAMSAIFGMLANRISTPKLSASNGLITRRILVFGTGQRALAVKTALNKSDPSAEIVGFFPSPNEDSAAVPKGQILSRSASLTETALKLNVHEIVVALTERRGGSMPLRELLDCKLHGVHVLDLASHFEKTLGQIRLESLYAGWLIFGDGFSQGALRSAIKRFFDIFFASLLLLLSMPIMIVTALVIVLESGAPVLYVQERVGRNGQPIKVIKFRSMRTDAEKDGRPIWAQKQDDRTTRVGRIIRKLRIDELPQLYCVLKGTMSLVGPRPERQFFVDQLTNEIPFYAVRHSVKPGLTGWAQVRYHYGATVEDSAEKLQYDLYYVKNHSFILDIIILYETVAVVLTGKGAH